jgi:hypothetical protein
VAKVAGMSSRLVRRTAIACAVAAVAGAGLGFALGDPVQPEDILPARKLPADFCAQLGDVSSLLPKAPNGTDVKLIQGGTTAVTCEVSVGAAQKLKTYSAAKLRVTITPYGGKDAGAGQAPFTPTAMAKRTFERSSLEDLKDRPYPTKLSQTTNGVAPESWTVRAVVQRADIVVQVEYTANPITQKKAEQAALTVADRAIWETK